jgi:O-antigen ligase
MAILSVIWSILYQVTLLKAFILVICTIMGVYIGKKMGSRRFFDILSWFFTVLCILNLSSVLLFPQFSIMPEEFYHHAWRGLFWHRNYLGCFMALGMSVYLINLLNWKRINRSSKIINSLMFLIAVFLLVKSKSATGIITSIILMSICFLLAAWLRWEIYLKTIHYWIFLGALIISMILVFSNLGFLFGLLDRDISLTGRVPMWTYLFRNIISQRPILGYGFGVIWSLEGFRKQLSLIVGWPNQVLIGDNGFIDILLHLGFLGLTTFLGLIVLALIRSVKHFLQMRSLTSAFPLVVIFFMLISNISLSLILESESFFWVILVASQLTIGKQYLFRYS